MPSFISYKSSAHLPKLGWFASLDIEDDRLSVVHGRAVECHDRWMVEGVWDGPFEAGEFHRGAHLFGSGIRLDDDGVHFIPSCALVDRLLYCRDGERLLVSNSLVILLAMTGARPDPLHDYRIEAQALATGIDDYDTAFHVKHARIAQFHQVFHKAMVVTNGVLSLERRIGLRDFQSFEDYRGMLSEHIAAICDNAADAQRRTPLTAFGTLSTGYDSTAVTAIVKSMGVKQFFTYAGAWGKRTAEHDATAIATAMKVETIALERAAPEVPEDELRLIAGSPLGQQHPLLAMARHVELNCEAGLVFTGYQGGVMWNANVPAEYRSTQMKRRDTSGLDLTELRLKSGFFNVAVPFLFAASIESVSRVSQLPELAPWRLGNDYDRPIPRRIVEEAGVPRHLFGFAKSGLLGGGFRPLHPQLRERYFNALSRNHGTPRPFVFARLACDRATSTALAKAANLLGSQSAFANLHRRLKRQVWKFNDGDSWFGRTNFRVAMYCWALGALSRELGETSAAVVADVSDSMLQDDYPPQSLKGRYPPRKPTLDAPAADTRTPR